MNLFCNRPFALGAFVAAGVAFVASFSFVSHRWIFALAFLAVAAVLFIVALIRRRCGAVQSTAILACLLSGLLLFSSWGFFDRQIGFLEQTGEKEVFAEGIVEERLSTSPNQTRFSFSLKEIDGKRVNQKVVLRCEYLSALRAGERIRVCGTVSNMQTLLSQENFTYRIADGFSGMLNCETAEDCMLLSGGEKSLFLRLSEWNTALSERLSSNIGGREGGLAAALILGNRNFLSPQDTLAFRRTGISHFLALSGLHVGILLAALERLLRLFRIPRKGRVVAMILLSLGYLAVTGASPSTLRAVFMADLLAGAFLFRESYDSPTAIFVALFAILFFQPYSVVDSGLWLSFFAAGGIVIFIPAVRELTANGKKIPKKAIHPVKRAAKALALAASVGLFAFTATLPVSAAIFGEISVLSVPVTLLLSPLLSVALVLSALCLLVPLPPLFFLAQKALSLLRLAANWFSEWRGITVLTQDRVTLIFLSVTALALFLCAVLHFRKKWLSFLPVLLAFVALISAYTAVPSVSQPVGVDYFSQKGSEYLLFTHAGKACAVDFSGGNKDDSYEMVAALHDAGCTELEVLALTHYHTPSTYLLNRIAGKIKLRKLLLPTPLNEEEEAVCARLKQEAELLGIPIEICDESNAVAGLNLRWLHDEGLKEPAVTLVARTKQSVLVWCNAKEASARQTALFERYAGNADVFIFGQHGASAGTHRSVPELCAETILVGEWRSSATPFLPGENAFYQTVSGQVSASMK